MLLAARKPGPVEQNPLNDREKPASTGKAMLSGAVNDMKTSDPSTASTRRKVRKQSGHDDHSEAWDITPMVDVAFLLLIFFMVTASFSIEKVIRTVPEPEKKAGGRTARIALDEEVETIIIQIDENSCYSLIPHDGDRIDTPGRQSLLTNLKLIRRVDDDLIQKISIQAHEESNHSAIVGAMDAASEANYSHIDFKVVEELL